MSHLTQSALTLLKQNKRETNGNIYTLPSPTRYPYQWFWDSCFHSIVLSHLDPGWAKQELLSLVTKQFDNGLLPHMIYWKRVKKFDIEWGKEDTSSITQPPIIALAVSKIFEKDSDLEFLKKIYPSLKKYYNYLLRERDSRGNHLIGLINPDESGEDNSSRFDVPLNAPAMLSLDEHFKLRLNLIAENKTCDFDAKRCMKNFFWVKDVPFNCLMVFNLEALSKLAKALHLKEDEEYFIKQSKLVKEAMRKYMFDDGIFWSIYQLSYNEDTTNYKKIRVKTWAIFAPLFAKMLTQNEAEHLVDQHLLNKGEFWLKYPIPTISFDEPSFNPEGYWRGPTWMAINWFIFHGLLNYKFFDIAKQVYKVSKYLVETAGFREYYNPLTGAGLGAKNFTWGTLVLDMERSLSSKD